MTGIGSLEGNSWGSVGCRYWVPKVDDAAEEEGDGQGAGKDNRRPGARRGDDAGFVVCRTVKDDQARNIDPSSIRFDGRCCQRAGWRSPCVAVDCH